MRTAVVDFDQTLIRTDSTKVILRSGFWYASFPILWWGFLIFGLRFCLPYEKQVWFRRKFRHALFREIYKRDKEKYLDLYTELLDKEFNQELADYIQANYDRVIVSTAAWKELVERVLAKKNIRTWAVQGTDYDPDFSKFYTCWNKEKIKRLKKVGIVNFDVFTDSKEDTPIIRAAQKFFLVKDGIFTVCTEKF